MLVQDEPIETAHLSNVIKFVADRILFMSGFVSNPIIELVSLTYRIYATKGCTLHVLFPVISIIYMRNIVIF